MFFEVSQEGLHGKHMLENFVCDTHTPFIIELLFVIPRKADLFSSVYVHTD